MSFIYRCVLNWRNTANNLNAQNVLYFNDRTDVLTTDQIGSIIDTNWWQAGGSNANLRGYTSGNVRLETINIARVIPGPATGGVPFVCQSVAGTQGTLVKHPVLGMVFTIKDGLAGRKHRGRMYHYGAVASHLTDSGPASALLAPTGLPLLFTRWMNEFGPSGVSPLQWFLFHRNGTAPGVHSATAVTSIQASPRCCVQRRRNFGIGL